MKHFKPSIELAVDFAANEIAKAVSDIHSVDYSKVRKNVRAMVCAAISGSCTEAGWAFSAEENPWLRSAEDPGTGLDKNALDSALNKWWDTLDDKTKLDIIFGPAGHHKSEYINNLKQKYQDKPEALLGRDIPDLMKAYRSELAPRQPAMTPDAPPQEEAQV